MSEMVASTRGLTEALKTLLADETGRPGGSIHAPLTGDGDSAEYPFIRLWQADSNEFFGSPFVSPEEAGCFTYVVACCGLRDDQVEWLREKVQEILIGKAVYGHGGFLHEISYANHAIIGRTLGLKARMRLEGTTYIVEDLYKFDVTRTV